MNLLCLQYALAALRNAESMEHADNIKLFVAKAREDLDAFFVECVAEVANREGHSLVNLQEETAVTP